MFAHNITIHQVENEVTLRCGDHIIAKTERALKLHEPPLLPVYYVPRDDIEMSLLTPSTHKTSCPFKGEATYYNLEIENDFYDNAAWSYESPRDEVAEIKGFLAFYDSVANVSEKE